MKGQSKTMDNRECACTGDYKSTEEEILLHHVLIKLRYLKDGRETVVLKFLTTTEVPCKGWQVQVTVSRRITPVLKQELQPFTLNNSMVLFPEICHTKNTFLDFFFTWAVEKSWSSSQKVQTCILAISFPRTQLVMMSAGQGNCSRSYYLPMSA